VEIVNQSNIYKLNLLITEAFGNLYLEQAQIKEKGLISKVKEYVYRTEKPLKHNPMYHKAAINLIEGLWSQSNYETVLNEYLRLLKGYEKSRRKERAEHRDHIAHSASVFLLGLVFMHRSSVIQTAINDWQNNKHMSLRDCLELWMWCATLHDLGYPTYKDFQWEQLEGFFQVYCPKFIKTPEIVKGFKNNGTGHHGLASAAIALKIFREPKKNLTFSNLSPNYFSHIINAIAFHDKTYGQQFFKISLNERPFLFLLILCDEIQFWNRPSKKVKPFIRSDFVYLKIDKIENKEILTVSIDGIKKSPKRIQMIRGSYETLKEKLCLNQLEVEIIINRNTILFDTNECGQKIRESESEKGYSQE
jgi:hypothetical protein